jgi:hypothetical protein
VAERHLATTSKGDALPTLEAGPADVPRGEDTTLARRRNEARERESGPRPAPGRCVTLDSSSSRGGRTCLRNGRALAVTLLLYETRTAGVCIRAAAPAAEVRQRAEVHPEEYRRPVARTSPWWRS